MDNEACPPIYGKMLLIATRAERIDLPAFQTLMMATMASDNRIYRDANWRWLLQN